MSNAVKNQLKTHASDTTLLPNPETFYSTTTYLLSFIQKLGLLFFGQY